MTTSTSAPSANSGAFSALTLLLISIIAYVLTRSFLRQLGGEPDAAAE